MRLVIGESGVKILSAFFILILSVGSSITHAQTANNELHDNPYMMIQTVGQRTFDRLKNERSKIDANPEHLRTIMEEEMLPYVDYKFSAFKVLGKYVGSSDRKTLFEFVSVFREYLITSYAVAMGYYNDQQVEFAPEMDFENRTDVTVRAVIKDQSRPDIKVAFKVRYDRNANKWGAYDMIAEGISMLSSKQSEFESVLRKEGIEAVIAMMRESIKQPIKVNRDSEYPDAPSANTD